MKNNQKTNFQKYLEKHNLGKSTETPQMSDEVRISYTKKFYRKYIENFHETDPVAGMRIFCGNTEEGNCIITGHGGIYCESTGLVANPVKYLRATENILTEQGAYDRYFTDTMPAVNSSEGNHEVLDSDHLFRRIHSFRNNGSIVDKLKSFGLKKENAIKYPFCYDGLSSFFYLYLTRLGFAVCKDEWSFDGDLYKEKSFGVPRLIESPGADIYFVENPIQLISMSELVSDSIYVRPTTGDCLNNDFARLIKGKQVLCFKSKNQRNADPAALDLTELKSDNINELLYFYDQDLPKTAMASVGPLQDILSNIMDEASASIDFFLKEKDVRL